MAMRVTQHNGRRGKSGVYSTKHNDRADTDKAEHIDTARSENNRYWVWNVEGERHELNDGLTFDNHESEVYNSLFSDSLAAQNARHIERRQKSRCQTMDEYRRNYRYCPEETIFQLGKVDNTASPDVLVDVTLEYLAWEQQNFPLFKPLDMALHVDEQGAAHIHKRGVWTYEGADGLTVGQDKALEAMGVQLRDGSKERGRHNNRKQVFSAVCRAKFEEICVAHGIEVEMERLEPSKVGKDLLTYQAEQERAKLHEAERQASEAEQRAAAADERAKLAASKAEKSEKAVNTAEKKLTTLNKQCDIAAKELGGIIDKKARASEIKRSIFDKSDIQSYHVNMLEQTRKLGDDAYDHSMKALNALEKAEKLKQQAADKEKEIEPLHAAARSDREEAARLLAHQQTEIRKKAQEMSERVIAETFQKKPDSRTERLERFLQAIPLTNGKTALQAFEEQERAERERSLDRVRKKYRGQEH